MNKQNGQNWSKTPAKPVVQAARPMPDGSAGKPGKSNTRADPKKTAQEPVHQVLSKEEAKKVQAADPAKSATPLRAAKGDDDLMSKQQHQAMPSADEMKGKWKQQMGNAKIAWGKLTDDELLKSEGHEQKLAGLVQERYAVTREEAHKQVKGFFEKYRH